MKPIEIKQLGHLVLYVKDLQKSIHFYREILGWQQIPNSNHNFPAAAFTGGTTHHELLLIEVGPQAAALPQGLHLGLYHFGLKIGDSDDDLRRAFDHLEKNNVPIIGATDHTVSHSLYIQDPDGNEIELYVDVPGVDWQNHPEQLFAPGKYLDL